MRLKAVELSFIKSFKSACLDLDKTSVLVGQNDHGKSSLLKTLDIVLNEINDEMLDAGLLHPDLAERLLPIFPVNAKARRITLIYDEAGAKKKLHFTVRKDLTFTVLETIKRNAKTTPTSLDVLKALRKTNRFVLIPAIRDASSAEFLNLFSRTLKPYLDQIIPQKAGGTPKEYRTLKDIRDQVSTTIKPYINQALLPKLESYFGFQAQHKLALKFDVDVADIGSWILNNLRLGFQLDQDDAETTLALTEAGSGVQSGVLLALHRLENAAAQEPDIQYILAVEEPEAFLHPQKQKELYGDALRGKQSNIKIIVTTHSPYIVADTSFGKLGLVRKEGLHSSLHTPVIADDREAQIFDTYSSEVNSLMLFAEKVVFVEGESDARVIKVLLEKKLGVKSHRISIISAAGNQNFSPFLRMMKAWSRAGIPHLVVTDFDSLTSPCERAIIVGAKAAGYHLANEGSVFGKIDAVLEKNEDEFEKVAIEIAGIFAQEGLNLFIFTSDLEHSLITGANRDKVAEIMATTASKPKNSYNGYDLIALRKQIGSKGIPLNPMDKPPFKKPFVHRMIADTIDLKHAHNDITRLLNAIESL